MLWAFGAFNKDFFLKLEGPKIAKKGQFVTIKVTDGMTSKPLAGASVEGETTNAQGEATITFLSRGLKI